MSHYFVSVPMLSLSRLQQSLTVFVHTCMLVNLQRHAMSGMSAEDVLLEDL